MNEQTPCQVIHLGRMDYLAAWEVQKRLAAERAADAIPDTLLWVEHPHTYTLGTSGHDDNMLLSSEELQARKIALYHVDRGGDVTYHGPGQLVGYPIIKLTSGVDNLHADVIGYVRGLEQTLIAALSHYGIAAWPYPGLTGVWVGEQAAPAKIAAIGVKVTTRRVTLHGLALNVNTDLQYFKGIIPCGITDKAVTSMKVLRGQALNLQEVTECVTAAFSEVFHKDMIEPHTTYSRF